MKSILEAQQDMRVAYFSGATGALTSATVWLIAALVVMFIDTKTGIWTLFFGGMFIFPISILFDKFLGRSGKHAKSNPLGPLAMEGTIWMILGIIIALGFSTLKPEWFFPAMLLIIGGRYLTFTTLFGIKIYYVFGATLVAAGFVVVYFNTPIVTGAFAGALIEYVFGAVLLLKYKE